MIWRYFYENNNTHHICYASHTACGNTNFCKNWRCCKQRTFEWINKRSWSPIWHTNRTQGLALKNNIFTICICLTYGQISMTTSQQSVIANNYYTSYSPYLTPGYLLAQKERRGALYGPSPYIYNKTISRTTYPYSTELWRRKRIDITTPNIRSDIKESYAGNAVYFDITAPL